jgi:carnosine N-methyltransferase
MSMCAGDFAEVYRKPEYVGAFDCVATCFFIDTAHNVIDYLHILYALLRVSPW